MYVKYAIKRMLEAINKIKQLSNAMFIHGVLNSAEPGKGIILYMNSQNCFSVGFRNDILHNYQIFQF